MTIDSSPSEDDQASDHLGRDDHTVVCWLWPPTDGQDALNRMLEHLPPTARLVVGVIAGVDAHAIDRSSMQVAETIDLPAKGTLAHLANRATKRWAREDLALVLPDTIPVGPWLDRLRAACAAESIVATVSALGDGLPPFRDYAVGSTGSGSRGGKALHGSAENRAKAVMRTSARIYPRLAAALPTCVYVRRAALDLVGPFDETLRSSHAAILDLALRASQNGLANLLADDLLVSAPATELVEEDRHTLERRYSDLMEAAHQPPGPALERSIALARVAFEPLSVTFDARALGPHVGGTQMYLMELLEALAAGGEVRLRALVGPDLATSTKDRLTALDITLLDYEEALNQPETSHVVHRPQQIFTADDLLLLRPLGKRIVITHHDLIAYHNPTYFSSNDLWRRFVRTTRTALATADRVLFFSRHALLDAEREDLVEPSRCQVVHLGVDSNLGPDGGVDGGSPKQVPALWPIGSTPFLLCLGADYRHKNRPFALSLLDELRRLHGWKGAIVLAGPHVEHGSSHEEEQLIRRSRSINPELVIELPAISDSERNWLMSNAAAVVYPTVYEGFGLVPFEAATFGTPCLFAAQSSLAELFASELAKLVPWDPVLSAANVAPLLIDGRERRAHVDGLRRTARTLRWADCAQATVESYRQALAAPYRASAESAWQALEREREIVILDQSASYHRRRVLELMDDLGPDALALVGPNALLSRADQHALLSVAARPTLRRLLFGGLRGGYRAMHSGRRSHR